MFRRFSKYSVTCSNYVPPLQVRRCDPWVDDLLSGLIPCTSNQWPLTSHSQILLSPIWPEFNPGSFEATEIAKIVLNFEFENFIFDINWFNRTSKYKYVTNYVESRVLYSSLFIRDDKNQGLEFPSGQNQSKNVSRNFNWYFNLTLRPLTGRWWWYCEIHWRGLHYIDLSLMIQQNKSSLQVMSVDRAC